MVRIDERLASDEPEDLARLDAERALVAANEHDGGNIGDLSLLLGSTGRDAVLKAIELGWLVPDGDVVHITSEGRDYYLHHLAESSRYPLDFSGQDSRREDAAIIKAGLVHVMPVEHTTYAPPRLPKSKKIEDR
jgi:hypothetical protein